MRTPEQRRGLPTDAPHVVVVGAGFAGLAAARRLGRAAQRMPLRVTLVDRNNYHTFQPLLYQAATASLEPHTIGRNLRSELRGLPVDILYAEVEDVEPDAKRLELRGGGVLEYDMLVLAAGAETASYGIDGVDEHAFPLKWLPDATRLRDHLLRTFEQLEAEPTPEPTGDSTFVVVGAGPTGVELSGAIAELIAQVIRRDHPHVDPSSTRVVLVEMAEDVLPPYGPESRRYTRSALEARGVEVRTGTAIDEVAADHVRLDNGESIPTRTVVWTAGVRANPLGDALGAESTKGGRVVVEPDLGLPGREDVFVVGDLAAAEGDDGEVLPQLAPVAIQQGQHAAVQVVRRLRSKPTIPFRYEEKGQMATIGRRAAVAELASGMRLQGPVGWVAWLGLHVLYLVGFRNRLAVLMNWSYNYLTYDRAARLILRPPQELDQRGTAGEG
jgi:NADH:ubiquinone reductase (H+-translocating)